MQLSEAITTLISVDAERKALELSYARRRHELDLTETKVQAVMAASRAGFDVGKISLARSVLAITGKYAKAGADRTACVSEAMRQIAGWTQGHDIDLIRRFVGTKAYEHWIGQLSIHDYGYGPRHGSILFSVGLVSAVRERSPFHLSDAERDACLYFLNAIEQIEQAEAEAPKAIAS